MKSADFPVLGVATAAYHTVGDEIDGQAILSGLRTITVDDMLVSGVAIHDLDAAMLHYDVRSHYSSEIGRALAETEDRQRLQMAVLAARTTAPAITGFPGGGVITEASANAFDNADTFLQALFDAKTTLLEKNVPEDEIVAFLPHRRIQQLVFNGRAIHRDYGGQGGSITDGKLHRIDGLDVVGTNRVPSTNVTNGSLLAGTGNKYAGNFTKTAGLVTHKSCIGTVQLLGLSVESDREVRRKSDFMVASFAKGMGVLRPEAAVEIARF